MNLRPFSICRQFVRELEGHDQSDWFHEYEGGALRGRATTFETSKYLGEQITEYLKQIDSGAPRTTWDHTPPIAADENQDAKRDIQSLAP